VPSNDIPDGSRPFVTFQVYGDGPPPALRMIGLISLPHRQRGITDEVKIVKNDVVSIVMYWPIALI